MKGVLLFVVFGVFANLNAQSLESFSLKGNVKSIEEELKICSNQNGKPQNKECSSVQNVLNFSEKGFYLEDENSVEFQGVTREKKQTSNGFIENVYKTEDGVTVKLAENYYNKENLILRKILFDDEGVISSVTEYFYDEKGRLTKREKISYFDGEQEKMVSFFDEYGTSKAIEIYVEDKLKSLGNFDIQYKFDEKGNWIQSTVVNQFSTNITSRKIIYY